MDQDAFVARWLPRVRTLQAAIRERLRARMAAQDPERNAEVARDEEGGGDTIFAIDVDADRVVVEHCERWAEEDAFVLVGEGVEPDGERRFGSGAPSARLIVDPIDGTRGLMFDKRSAWSLAAVAPDHGAGTRLAHAVVAAMAELPTTRQALVDDLDAVRGRGVRRIRRDLWRGTEEERPVRPSTATTLRHGFATVCSYFQGGRERIARLDEEFVARALGGWRHDKAEVYSDQYISSGGLLAELVLGRDRFVCDVRQLVHASLGFDTTLCSRPYDLCTALVAAEAGVVVLDPVTGAPFDAPMDTTTNCNFVAYANRRLAEALQPMLMQVLREQGLRAPDPRAQEADGS